MSRTVGFPKFSLADRPVFSYTNSPAHHSPTNHGHFSPRISPAQTNPYHRQSASHGLALPLHSFLNPPNSQTVKEELFRRDTKVVGTKINDFNSTVKQKKIISEIVKLANHLDTQHKPKEDPQNDKQFRMLESIIKNQNTIMKYLKGDPSSRNYEPTLKQDFYASNQPDTQHSRFFVRHSLDAFNPLSERVPSAKLGMNTHSEAVQRSLDNSPERDLGNFIYRNTDKNIGNCLERQLDNNSEVKLGRSSHDFFNKLPERSLDRNASLSPDKHLPQIIDTHRNSKINELAPNTPNSKSINNGLIASNPHLNSKILQMPSNTSKISASHQQFSPFINPILETSFIKKPPGSDRQLSRAEPTNSPIKNKEISVNHIGLHKNSLYKKKKKLRVFAYVVLFVRIISKTNKNRRIRQIEPAEINEMVKLAISEWIEPIEAIQTLLSDKNLNLDIVNKKANEANLKVLESAQQLTDSIITNLLSSRLDSNSNLLLFLHKYVSNGTKLSRDYLMPYEVARLEFDQFGNLANMSKERKALLVSFFIISRALVRGYLLEIMQSSKGNKKMNKNIAVVCSFIQYAAITSFSRIGRDPQEWPNDKKIIETRKFKQKPADAVDDGFSSILHPISDFQAFSETNAEFFGELRKKIYYIGVNMTEILSKFRVS